jgi:hypothetical protein
MMVVLIRAGGGGTIEDMSATDAMNKQQFLSYKDLDSALEEEFHPARLSAETFKHPVSGYDIEKGPERRLARPPEGQQEAPAEFQVNDYGSGRMGEYRRDVRREPIEHVYRGISHEEYKQALNTRVIQSDQRGTISDWEGTNAATDPQTAVSYLPRGGQGHILKIAVRPEDKWFSIPQDQYVRTREPIPLDRVEHVMDLNKNDKGFLSR